MSPNFSTLEAKAAALIAAQLERRKKSLLFVAMIISPPDIATK
jgi:hypothetical protein